MASIARVVRESRIGKWLSPAFSPARTLSLAFLTLGGFLAGVLFWGGFNTVLPSRMYMARERKVLVRF